MGLVLIAALGATWPPTLHGSGASPIWPSWLWAVFIAGAALTAPVVLRARRLRPTAAAATVVHPEWVGTRIDKLTAALSRFREHPGALAGCFSGAVFVQGLMVAFYLAVVYALKIPITASDLAVIVPLSLVVQMLPVSVNGLGLREATFSFYFARLGLPIESAVLLSLMGAALMMLFSLSGAAVYVSRGRLTACLLPAGTRRSSRRPTGSCSAAPPLRSELADEQQGHLNSDQLTLLRGILSSPEFRRLRRAWRDGRETHADPEALERALTALGPPEVFIRRAYEIHSWPLNPTRAAQRHYAGGAGRRRAPAEHRPRPGHLRRIRAPLAIDAARHAALRAGQPREMGERRVARPPAQPRALRRQAGDAPQAVRVHAAAVRLPPARRAARRRLVSERRRGPRARAVLARQSRAPRGGDRHVRRRLAGANALAKAIRRCSTIRINMRPFRIAAITSSSCAWTAGR